MGEWSPVSTEHRVRIGEDRPLFFKVTIDEEVPPDLSSWSFAFALRESREDLDIFLPLVSPTDIAVVLHEDPDPPHADIEMVRVQIARESWDDIIPGRYFYSLVRTDTGTWRMLAEGPFPVDYAAVR